MCQSTRCILSNIIAVTKHKNDIDVVQCHETIVIAIDGALCCRFSSISFSLEWCVQLQWSPHWAHVTFTQLRSNLSQMHSRLVIRILNSVANSEYLVSFNHNCYADCLVTMVEVYFVFKINHRYHIWEDTFRISYMIEKVQVGNTDSKEIWQRERQTIWQKIREVLGT